MSGWLIDFLIRRDPRERWLLALLFGLVLPLALLFGVLAPLHEAKSEALVQRNEAVALHNWVQKQIDQLQEGQLAPEKRLRPSLSISRLEQSLIDAGLRDEVGTLSRDGAGLIALRFEQVEFTKLMNWISRMSPDWGYDIVRFRFEASAAPGYIQANLTLAPQSDF